MRLIEILKSLGEDEDIDKAAFQKHGISDIESIIQKWGPKLRSQKIALGAELGSGSRGIAYELPMTRQALKITSDKSEANAANILVGKKLKNVCEFYRIFQFDSTGYYGIVQELLEPLSYGSNIQFLEKCLNHEVISHAITQSQMPNWEEEVLAELQSYSMRETVSDKQIDVAERGIKEIMNGIKEIHQNGINFIDLHSGNVMLRGDVCVIIDLGYSKSAAQKIEEI